MQVLPPQPHRGNGIKVEQLSDIQQMSVRLPTSLTISTMKVINLFAEPGAGKSTTASGLFFGMKHMGLRVELVTEYAKACVWEGKKQTLDDQLYVTAKQNHQMERLRGKVDFIITDSPLLLGLVYCKSTMFPSFRPLLKEVFDSYENFNVLIRRSKKYCPEGRMQSEFEAANIALQIRDLLVDFNMPFVETIGNVLAPQKIFIKMVRQGFIENRAWPTENL